MLVPRDEEEGRSGKEGDRDSEKAGDGKESDEDVEKGVFVGQNKEESCSSFSQDRLPRAVVWM